MNGSSKRELSTESCGIGVTQRQATFESRPGAEEGNDMHRLMEQDGPKTMNAAVLSYGIFLRHQEVHSLHVRPAWGDYGH